MKSPAGIAAVGMLVVVGLATRWYLAQLQDLVTPPEVVPGAIPDYVLRDFELAITDEKGRRTLLATAPHMEVSSVDQSSVVEQPLISVFEEDAPRWQIRAPRGWISSDGEQAFFAGPTTAEEQLEGGIRLYGFDVMLDIPRDQVRSALPALLVRPQITLAGVGVFADLQANHFQLLQDVTGHYDPR